MILKERFLEAVKKGQIGHIEEQGVIVTLQEFKQCFSDIKSQYVTSFLPAATIEPGRISMSYTKFVFRVRSGVYRVHKDALK